MDVGSLYFWRLERRSYWDLLEEFHTGRSGAWYWRQALTTLAVGFAARLRVYRMPLTFSIGWSLLYPMVWPSVVGMGSVRTLWQRVAAHDWPYSTGLQSVGEMMPTLLFMWFGFLVYLLMSKRLVSQVVTVRSLAGLSISLNVLLLMIIGQHLRDAGVEGWSLSQQNDSAHLAAHSVPLAVSLFSGLVCLLPQRRRRVHRADSLAG